MKVDKLTQLFEGKKETLDNWKNKIKKIDKYLILDLAGSGYNSEDKYKNDINEILNAKQMFSDEEFFEEWSHAFGLNFNKDFNKNDFKNGGYLEEGFSLTLVYNIIFFDRSSIFVDYDEDYNRKGINVQDYGEIAEEFINRVNSKKLIFNEDDLDEFKPQAVPNPPTTTKPKVEID